MQGVSLCFSQEVIFWYYSDTVLLINFQWHLIIRWFPGKTSQASNHISRKTVIVRHDNVHRLFRIFWVMQINSVWSLEERIYNDVPLEWTIHSFVHLPWYIPWCFDDRRTDLERRPEPQRPNWTDGSSFMANYFQCFGKGIKILIMKHNHASNTGKRPVVPYTIKIQVL